MNGKSMWGRRWLAVLLVLAAGTAPAASRAASPGAPAAPAVTAVGPIGLTVADLDRSVAFYTDVLGFVPVGEVERTGEALERYAGVFGLRVRVARLRLGREEIELTDYLAPEGRAIPEDTRSNDRWFQHIAIVTRDMDRAYAWLRGHDVRHASTGPQRLPDWNPNAGGIEAFYFKDPDGHHLEIIAFPRGKGNPRWATEPGDLFLGIDHTAIVVDDTEASLAFYRDALGLTVAGTSENWGTEQEHLNNVFGARLRITGLKAAAGPGIEFLEYLAPSNGRARPADAAANDLIHWQTRLIVNDANVIADRLAALGAAFVSPGAVRLDDAALGIADGLLVRDPDGHVLAIVEPTADPTLTRKESK
jgi:catechol 2,3-dioxygenase-like lactoylglutathione lyase family enzyme